LNTPAESTSASENALFSFFTKLWFSAKISGNQHVAVSQWAKRAFLFAVLSLFPLRVLKNPQNFPTSTDHDSEFVQSMSRTPPRSPPRPDDFSSTLSLTSSIRRLFTGEVLLERIGTPDNPPAAFPARATVFVTGSNPIETVRIDLSNDSDLFFVFESEYDERTFGDLRANQDLSLEFSEFPGALEGIFASAGSRDGEFTLQFTDGDEPQLAVLQHLKFKTVTVFSLGFRQPSDEAIKDRFQNRYNEVRSELASVRADLTSVYAMLKIKNPSVLKQVKSPRKSPFP
jgi:hypothetical protein